MEPFDSLQEIRAYLDRIPAEQFIKYYREEREERPGCCCVLGHIDNAFGPVNNRDKEAVIARRLKTNSLLLAITGDRHFMAWLIDQNDAASNKRVKEAVLKFLDQWIIHHPPVNQSKP